MKRFYKQYTLIMIRNKEYLLLGMKKRGFGVGKWNGFGGKVEENESIVECAHRELKEECGIESNTLKSVGRLLFEFEGDPKLLDVHVFTSYNWTGEPTESEEMRPNWFKINEIPYSQMWLDAKDWIPIFLSEKSFYGYFKYSNHGKVFFSNSNFTKDYDCVVERILRERLNS